MILILFHQHLLYWMVIFDVSVEGINRLAYAVLKQAYFDKKPFDFSYVDSSDKSKGTYHDFWVSLFNLSDSVLRGYPSSEFFAKRTLPRFLKYH